MKPVSKTVLNIALGLVLGLLIAGQLAFDKPLFRLEKKTEASSRVTAPPLPQQLSFAGEGVPLNRWDVKERLEREVLINYYSHANMIFLLKTANRYFPVIEARLKANGVPDDFKYLCIAESNLVPAAISSSGAVSFWQFMNGTAPGYGLEVNKEVDQRYDLAKATDAACSYLKSAYAKFGNWTAAAASYNCGQGGYNGQATYQGTNNYYDLLLPEETNRYIFRILTFKYLLEKAPELGFEVPESERYSAVPARSVTVSSSIPDLAAYARQQGTTYKMLRQLNPWLRGRSLTVSSGKTYTLQLPTEGKAF
jgi:membrane-bound lytic murein transglycosylase D